MRGQQTGWWLNASLPKPPIRDVVRMETIEDYVDLNGSRTCHMVIYFNSACILPLQPRLQMVCLRTLFLMMMTQPGPQYSRANDLPVYWRLMTEETDAYSYDAYLGTLLNNAKNEREATMNP